VRIERTRFQHNHGRNFQRVKLLQHFVIHGRRIPAKLCWIRQQENAHRAARFDQFTGHDESIAAVVAFAADNRNALRARKIGEDETRHGRARVVHQVNGRHAKALRGGAIDLAHFRRTHDLHACDPAVPSSSRRCCGSPEQISSRATGEYSSR
jgi:hypothetical protein